MDVYPYKGRGNDNAWGEKYADILTRIMGADMAVIPAEYDRAVQSEYPGGTTGHSHGPVDRFWMSLRASFPDATFTIDHQIGRAFNVAVGDLIEVADQQEVGLDDVEI